MNNIGGLNKAKNAALRAFYRFAEGELPFRETDNQEISVNLVSGRQLLELMEELSIENGPPLDIVAYNFSAFSPTEDEQDLSMSVRFDTRLPQFAPNGSLLLEFVLENRGGVWGVRLVIFHPTPAQQEIYFSTFPTTYDLWQ